MTAVGRRLERRTPLDNTRRPLERTWMHLDVVLIVATGLLALVGLVMIYSATRSGLASQGASQLSDVRKQLLFLVAGTGLAVVTVVIDHRIFQHYAAVIYLGAVAALVLVLSPLGVTVNFAQSWFLLPGGFQIQPAEFTKVAVIVMVAAYASTHEGDLDLRRLAVCLGIGAVPIGLIYLQPDLGSVLVFVAILMGVLLIAGARLRHILVLTLIGVAGVVGMLQMDVLSQYQRDRLTTFVTGDDEVDEGDGLGSIRYQTSQSKTAVAAGGLTGTGLFNGTQTEGGYVPEQRTDFIFTVVGEELGFVGSAGLLLLYGVVAWRILRAARLARDLFGTLICIGVLTMLMFQVFENVGMTMGIMPVTGLPLPLVSYGGSSMVTTLIGIGLVLNIHMRRFT